MHHSSRPNDVTSYCDRESEEKDSISIKADAHIKTYTMQNRSLEISPHLCGQLIYNERTKTIQRKSDSVFNKQENWTSMCKRMNWDHCLTKNQLRMD